MNLKKIFTLLVCLPQLSALCCTCIGEQTVDQGLKSADIVFAGKICKADTIRILAEESPNIIFHVVQYTIQVETIYKGKKGLTEIHVFSELVSSMCGSNFQIGGNYIVYAEKKKRYHTTGKKVKKLFYTNSCTRTCIDNKEERAALDVITGN